MNIFSLSRREKSWEKFVRLSIRRVKKNIDFSTCLLLGIDSRNTVGAWVIGGGKSESDVRVNRIIIS